MNKTQVDVYFGLAEGARDKGGNLNKEAMDAILALPDGSKPLKNTYWYS